MFPRISFPACTYLDSFNLMLLPSVQKDEAVITICQGKKDYEHVLLLIRNVPLVKTMMGKNMVKATYSRKPKKI